MTENECLTRFGIVPDVSDLPTIREILRSEIQAAQSEEDDSGLMKLCCIQLFSAGDPTDSMLIWSAKRSSFDNGINIDVQLLCGAGVARTKEHLSSIGSEYAKHALQYITECEASGDFDCFATDEVLDFYRNYYGLSIKPPTTSDEHQTDEHEPE